MGLKYEGEYYKERTELFKEQKVIRALQSYLETECSEEYKKNNLEKLFKQVTGDKDLKEKLLNSIDKFILN